MKRPIPGSGVFISPGVSHLGKILQPMWLSCFIWLSSSPESLHLFDFVFKSLDLALESRCAVIIKGIRCAFLLSLSSSNPRYTAKAPPRINMAGSPACKALMKYPNQNMIPMIPNTRANSPPPNAAICHTSFNHSVFGDTKKIFSS